MRVNTINTPAFWMHNTHFLCWSWWSDCRWAPYIHAELERRWPSPRSSPLYTVWDTDQCTARSSTWTKRQQRLWIKTEAWRRSKQITTAFYTCIRHDVRSWQRFSRSWLPRDKHIVPCPIKSHVTCEVVFVVFGTSPNALEWIVCWNTAVHLNGTGQRGHNPAETQLNTTDSCVGF